MTDEKKTQNPEKISKLITNKSKIKIYVYYLYKTWLDTIEGY